MFVYITETSPTKHFDFDNQKSPIIIITFRRILLFSLEQ